MRQTLAACALLVGLTAAGLRAQVSVDAELGVFSAFEDRGVTNANRPVLQPQLVLALPLGNGTIELGAWTNYEPARYDGPRDIASGGELLGPAFTRLDLWAEYGREWGPFSAGAGAATYRYPSRSGLAAAYQTWEPYAWAAWSGVLEPELALYYDVGSVHGLYAEASVSRTLAAAAALPLTFALLAGFSAGQAETAAEPGYFESDGLTHIDLSAGTSLPLGPLVFAPVLHLAFNRDAYTQLTSPDEPRSVKFWFGATVGWATPSPREEELP